MLIYWGFIKSTCCLVSVYHQYSVLILYNWTFLTYMYMSAFNYLNYYSKIFLLPSQFCSKHYILKLASWFCFAFLWSTLISESLLPSDEDCVVDSVSSQARRAHPSLGVFVLWTEQDRSDNTSALMAMSVVFDCSLLN